MASFLKKLISGDTVVDNSLPPDSYGIITRRIIKSFAAQPPEELGIKLSDDAEVIDVSSGSLSSESNLPTHFMIFEVNNMFVEDARSFFEKCRTSLTLTIKLHSLNAVSELIAKILSYEEKYSGEELQNVLKLDELMRFSPRFRFLSSDHPLFRRYTRRLQEKREANALIKQRVEETKEQEQKEILEKLKKAKEEIRRVEAEKNSSAAPIQPVLAPALEPTPFVSVYNQPEDLFSVIKDSTDEKIQNNSSVENVVTRKQEESTPEEDFKNIPVVSREELLALVGLGAKIQEENIEVSYVILPSEEYVLSSGEKVVHALKKRIGPPPSPPFTS